MDVDECEVTDRWENRALGERVRAWIAVRPEDDPRAGEGNETIILCAHRRYRLGDEQFDDRDAIEARKEEIEAGGGVLRPLYLYDHSGITVSTRAFSCRWDSGQIGWVGMEAEKLAARGLEPDDEAAISAIVEGEIAPWDAYLRGDVYAFSRTRVSQCDHGHEHETELGGCGGFYGHDHAGSGLIEAAEIGTDTGAGVTLADGWVKVGEWTQRV